MVKEVLVRWREDAGLSQAEAGRRMGFGSTATIHGHEHGRTRVSPELLRRYAAVYGRPNGDLVSALLLLAGVGSGETSEADSRNTPEIRACGHEVAL